MRSAAGAADPSVAAADEGEQHAGESCLLAQIEPPHREAVGDGSARNAEHHRFAPVALRDVEPEHPKPLCQIGRRIGAGPQRPEHRQILQRSGGGHQQRERQRSEAQYRAKVRAGGEHEKKEERRRQQNHREMVAQGKCVHAEEDPQSRQRGTLPPQQERARNRGLSETRGACTPRRRPLATRTYRTRPAADRRRCRRGWNLSEGCQPIPLRRTRGAPKTADVRFSALAGSPPLTCAASRPIVR